jgi:hypothetical protein
MTPVPIRRALASLPVNATKSRRNKNKEMAIPSRGWLHNIDKEGNSLLGRCAEQPLVVGLQRNQPARASRAPDADIWKRGQRGSPKTWRNPARSAWLPPAKPLPPAKVFMTPSSNNERPHAFERGGKHIHVDIRRGEYHRAEPFGDGKTVPRIDLPQRFHAEHGPDAVRHDMDAPDARACHRQRQHPLQLAGEPVPVGRDRPAHPQSRGRKIPAADRSRVRPIRSSGTLIPAGRSRSSFVLLPAPLLRCWRPHSPSRPHPASRFHPAAWRSRPHFGQTRSIAGQTPRARSGLTGEHS